MKLVTILIFFVFIYGNAYDNTKVQIDMHGGKNDSLSSKGSFSKNFQSLGTLNSNTKKKEIRDENFLKVEDIEKIEEIKEKNE